MGALYLDRPRYTFSLLITFYLGAEDISTVDYTAYFTYLAQIAYIVAKDKGWERLAET
jgi:hypothetical protein